VVWSLESRLHRNGGQSEIRPIGAVLGDNEVRRSGYWLAKETARESDVELRRIPRSEEVR